MQRCCELQASLCCCYRLDQSGCPDWLGWLIFPLDRHPFNGTEPISAACAAFCGQNPGQLMHRVCCVSDHVRARAKQAGECGSLVRSCSKIIPVISSSKHHLKQSVMRSTTCLAASSQGSRQRGQFSTSSGKQGFVSLFDHAILRF